MYQKQPHSNRSLFRESIKALEADIHHANTLAAALPPDDGGDSVQMKLSYSTFAPFLLYLIDWMDYSCTDSLPIYLGLLHILVYKVYMDGIQTMSSQERKATLREFYAVIYPSLKQLDGYLIELRNDDDDNKKSSCEDVNRDDECGICMETCDKMALPNCGHSICIACFRDWSDFCAHTYIVLENKDAQGPGLTDTQARSFKAHQTNSIEKLVLLGLDWALTSPRLEN